MWRAVPRGTTFCLAAGLMAAAACGRSSSDGVRSSPPSLAAGAQKSVSLVTPARFLPDLSVPPPGTTEPLSDGSRRFIVSGMRVIDHPDGSIERARQILPNGVAKVVSLPNRMGGGLIVYVLSGSGTQVWRAKSYLDDLEPLAELWGTVDELVAGFDRLYVRMTTGEVRAIDPDSGQQISLGPLPPGTRIRSLAFADAWRAAAIVDFRGALATFDAGNTWRPIPLDGINVNQVSVREGDFTLETSRGTYLLGPGGDLSRDESPREPTRGPSHRTESVTKEGGQRRFGFAGTHDPRGSERRPLRAAVEDGWPMQDARGETTAVYAQGGALYRVLLGTGAIVQTRRDVMRESDGACHAIPLRSWFGFVCDVSGGGSAIYHVEPTLEARELAHFAHARIIVPSGNGGYVVRGSCARDAPATTGASDVFCFVAPSGDERQQRAPDASPSEKGDLRPVVLRDGRALFVLSPKEGSNGKLFISRGAAFDIVPLSLDNRQALLRRAYVLEGVEEREPGVLGGWALLGEEFRGLRIGLDGHVELGPALAHVDRTFVAGRFGFDWGSSGRGFETVDGGMSWTPVDLPAAEPSRAARSVAVCGSVGCAKDNWVRVGWGKVGDVADLVLARPPARSRVSLAPARGVSLRCQPTGEMSGPSVALARPGTVAKKSVPSAPSMTGPAAVQGLPRVPMGPRPSPAPARPVTVDLRAGAAVSAGPPWTAFRGHAPPALASGDLGLEGGTDPPMTMQARIYTWGARGSEWTHSGHVQVRFDDRFEVNGTRSTAVSSPPWTDEDRASDALGQTAGQSINWTALLDPSGLAAVLVGQRGQGRADLYAAAAGEPLTVWRDADNAPLPAPNSVVRAGPTWFFLHSLFLQNAWVTTVYRVDAGVVRRLARLPRVPVPAGEFAPKLMRRARGKGIGLLIQGSPGFDQVIRDWYVLPIDPETGDLDEPVRLLGSDLEGQLPERCPDEGDGWMVNTDLSLAPAARLLPPSGGSLGAIELRLRLDPGKVCIEAIAARAEGLSTPLLLAAAPGVQHHDRVSFGATDLPMAATEASTGRRWLLKCGL